MNRRPLIFLVAAYLALRAGLLARHFDEVAMPNFELGVMGNLARLASDGDIGMPLHEYFDNVGGHLAVGLLAAPLYALLGADYLTLKLVPLLLGVATLLVLFPLLERLAGRRAAWLGATLFVLAPPTLLKYSLLAKGNHFEGLFLQLLAYALFVRAHDAPRRAAWLLGAGLASGLATTVYVGSLVLLAGVAAAHVALRGVRGAALDLRVVLPGLLVGASPLAWLALAPHGRLQEFLQAKVGSGASFGERVAHLFVDVLPRAGGFRPLGPLPAALPEALWLGAFALAWGLLGQRLWRALRGGEDRDAWLLLPVWTYLPLFALTFGATTFDFDTYAPPVEVGRFRYLVPHTLFAIVVIAAARRRAVYAAACLAALASLALFAGHVTDRASGARYRGYHFPYLATVLLKESSVDPATGLREWDHERVASVLRRFEPGVRSACYFGIGYQTALIEDSPELRGAPERTPLSLERLLERYPAEAHADIARGAGSYVRQVFARAGGGPERARERLTELLAGGHPRAGQVVEGLCLDFGYPLELVTSQGLVRSHEIQVLVPAGRAGGWVRGFGIQCGRLLGRGLPSDVAAVRADARKILAPDRPAFWFGVGYGMAEGAGADATLAQLQALAPAEQREWIAGGHGARRRQMEAAD